MPVSAPRLAPDLLALSTTAFHQRVWAELLGMHDVTPAARVTRTLAESKVDLNPHQVEAAAFALDCLSKGGCVLADEVGLGKTIEAGIVIAQLCAEGKGRVLILTPATLRSQWQSELADKFDLQSLIVDGRSLKGAANPFAQNVPVVASIPFAAAHADKLRSVAWDLVVIDEAHRLRNAHRAGHKTGRALKGALAGRPKLLLTATPLQNNVSELFGLLSMIDERILGPEEAFKARYPLETEDGEGLNEIGVRELKERLAPSVWRTLRRQVREYVRFTHRRSLVEDFTPSPEEQTLYEDVSEYLRRPNLAAIAPGRRTLLTLVYRKLLASSSHAIAPTLQKLADSLNERIACFEASASFNDFFSPAEAEDYPEEAEAWTEDESPAPPTLAMMKRELKELNAFAKAAAALVHNAKGEALKRAIDRLFTTAQVHLWPQKAVIFTESRRTQDYLFELLSKHGYQGRIALLSGAAGGPEERRAIVEAFRGPAQILLSTEAGAEGLNLQFCNIVVNYDLPWNPQRVEQRIGRCHRYGQERDVLVLNFLNRSNAADARLYELLEKKLCLFDGVFGASDEILGALASGVDFEKRVLDIYQSCRKPEEIDAAFDALRGDLEGHISERMTETRALLLERFDGEVRRRLKLSGEQTRAGLLVAQAQTQVLRQSLPGQQHATGRKLKEAASALIERPLETVSYLRLDASRLPAPLSSLNGQEGWWFVYRCGISGLKSEQRLLHLLLKRNEDGFEAVSGTPAPALLEVPATDEAERRPPSLSVGAAQQAAFEAARASLLASIQAESAVELDGAKERADRYAEDCLLPPRRAVEAARAEWEAARTALKDCAEAQARVKARAAAERAEREYRKKLEGLRHAEEQHYTEKDRTLAALASKAKVTLERSLVASAYFWVR